MCCGPRPSERARVVLQRACGGRFRARPAQPSSRTWGGQKWRLVAPAPPEAEQSRGLQPFRWEGCPSVALDGASGRACCALLSQAQDPPAVAGRVALGQAGRRGPASNLGLPGDNQQKASAGTQPRRRVAPQISKKTSC